MALTKKQCENDENIVTKYSEHDEIIYLVSWNNCTETPKRKKMNCKKKESTNQKFFDLHKFFESDFT